MSLYILSHPIPKKASVTIGLPAWVCSFSAVAPEMPDGLFTFSSFGGLLVMHKGGGGFTNLRMSAFGKNQCKSDMPQFGDNHHAGWFRKKIKPQKKSAGRTSGTT